MVENICPNNKVCLKNMLWSKKMLGINVWMTVSNILDPKILGKALRSRGWKFYSINVDNIFWKEEIFYSTNVDNSLSKFKVGEFEIEDEAA